jgi:hypothetical protein
LGYFASKKFLTNEIKNEENENEVILQGVNCYEEKLNEKGRKNCEIAIFASNK